MLLHTSGLQEKKSNSEITLSFLLHAQTYLVFTVIQVACVSFRCQEGIKFLEATEGQWQPRGSLVNHIWWHKGLYHFQLAQFEEAMTLLDNVILPNCKKSKY